MTYYELVRTKIVSDTYHQKLHLIYVFSVCFAQRSHPSSEVTQNDGQNECSGKYGNDSHDHLVNISWRDVSEPCRTE